MDSPASPTVNENGCRLLLTKSSNFGKEISYQLEHKSGEFWLGWVFNNDYATVRRPEDCRRVQFRMDRNGRPSSLGVDIRMEGDDTPLVWFERESIKTMKR